MWLVKLAFWINILLWPHCHIASNVVPLEQFVQKSIQKKKKNWSNISGVDKDYSVQISGKDLILPIVPETYSLVLPFREQPIKMKSNDNWSHYRE